MSAALSAALELALLAALASAIGVSFVRVAWRQSATVRSAVLLTALGLTAAVPAFVWLGRTLDLPRWRPVAPPAVVQGVTDRLSAANADAIVPEPVATLGSTSVGAPMRVGAAPAAAVVRSWSWWTGALLLVWLCGSVWTATRVVRGHRDAARLLLQARPTEDGELLRLAADAARTAGLASPPPLCVSSTVPTPITVGLVRPRIVLPAAVVRGLDRDGLRAVVLHEMAHVAHRDRWLRLLQQAVAILHWWNPPVRALLRRILAVCEELCDELAVTAVPPAVFADVLVGLAEAARRQRHGFTACAVLGAGELERRVRRLLSHPLTRSRRNEMNEMNALNRSWIAVAAVVQSAVLTLVAGALSAQETATLEVTVHWSDGQPAVGQRVETQELGAPNSGLTLRVTETDARGVATVTGLSPGLVHVRAAWRWTLLDRMSSGQTYRATTRLDGATIDGRVVTEGRPLAGARVFLWSMLTNEEGGQVAVSDQNGAFTVRDVPDGFRIGVRANGFAPTPLQVVHASSERVALRFEPTAPGGSLRGRVVDDAGRPIAGAQVFVGPERMATRGAGSPGELLVTRGDGSFATDSLPLGELDVRARASGHGPATVRLMVAGAEETTIALAPEVRVRGTVSDAAGRPVAAANVFAGRSWSFGSAHTTSSDDGSFELSGLPAGAIELAANDNAQRTAATTLTATAGETVEWHPRVEIGATLGGRVVDERGAPLEGWYVYTICFGNEPWYRGGYTDAQGRFTYGQRPATGKFALSTNPVGSGAPVVVVRDFDPAQSQEIVVPDRSLPSGRVRARLVTKDGRPAADAMLQVSFADGISPGLHRIDPKSGEVDVGPLPPRDYRIEVLRNSRVVERLGTVSVGTGAVVDLGIVVVE